MISSVKMNSVSAVSIKKGNVAKLPVESLLELNKVNQISNANSNINDYSTNMNGLYEEADYSKETSTISEKANANSSQASFVGPIDIVGAPSNISKDSYNKIINYAYKNNLGTVNYNDYEKNVNGNPLYKIDDYISSKATGDDILKDIKLYKSKNLVSAKADVIFSQSDEEILAKILEIKNAEIARREKAKTETISPSDPLTMVAPIAENSKLQYSIPSAQNYYSKDNVSNINYQPTIDLEKCDFVDDQYKKHAKELQDEITEQRRLLGALDGLYSDFKHRVTDVNEFNKTHSDNYSSIQQRAIDFDGTKYYYNETQAIGALEVIKKNYQNQKDLVYKAEKELWDYKIAAIQGTDYYKNYVKNIDIDAHLSDVSEAKYMTTEEKQFYCYLLETENEEISNSYFNHLKGEINSREGLERALKFVSELDLNDPNAMDYVKTHFKGLGDGTEQFFHGIEVWFTGPSKELTADQYEVLYIMELLKQSNANIETAIGDINGLEKVYSLSISEGNMLPAMVVGAIGSTFDCPELGAIVMFASVSGNSTENSYQQGYDLWSSWFYGIMDGASEATLEYLLGGIPGVSKLDDMGLLARAVSEGFEESMQEILDPYLRYIAFGEDPKVDVKKVLEAGIDGMVLAAYLNGGSIAITSGVTVSVDFLQENYDKIKNLEAKGVEIDYTKIKDENYLMELESKNQKETINLGDLTSIEFKQSKILEALKEYDLTEQEANSVCDLIMQTKNSPNYSEIATKLNSYNEVQLTSFFTIESQIDLKVVNELFLRENAKPVEKRSAFMNNLTSNLVENVLDYYQEAQEVGSQLEAFKTYRTHTEGHVMEVAERSVEAMKAIETSLKPEYRGQINYYELYVAGIWHDIGMGASEGGYIKGIDSQFDKITKEYAPKELQETAGGNITRSNHALNSALSVLENSAYFNSIGLDANIVALLAFAHTKSNSGIKDISNPTHWDTAIKMLDACWTEKNKGKEYTGFIEGLLDNGVIKREGNNYVLTPEYKKQIYAEAYALRYGDANTNNRNLGINQGGENVDIENNKPLGLETIKNEKSIFNIIVKEYGAVQYTDSKGEIKYAISSDRAKIVIGDKVLSPKECDPITVAFIIGENNIEFSTSNKAPDSSIIDNHVHEVIEINDSSIVGPTMFNINERIGEAVTGTKLISGELVYIDIVFPEGTSESTIKYYMQHETADTYNNRNDSIRFCYYIKKGTEIVKIKR